MAQINIEVKAFLTTKEKLDIALWIKDNRLDGLLIKSGIDRLIAALQADIKIEEITGGG